MKRILKTVLAVGLVASSSLALAEGKFAYRQPLQGVDASPTFGMTETERQEHLSNIEMCSQESLIDTGNTEEVPVGKQEKTLLAGEIYWSPPITPNGTNGYDYYHNDTSTYAYYVSDNYIEDGWTYYVNGNIAPQDLFDKGILMIKSGNPNEEFYKLIPKEDYIYMADIYEERPIYTESSNYQWCKDNGYQTAN